MLMVVGGDEEPSMRAQQSSVSAALHGVGGDATAVEVPGEDHMGLIMHLSRPGNATLAELLKFIDTHP